VKSEPLMSAELLMTRSSAMSRWLSYGITTADAIISTPLNAAIA
jgi:hypothetical protein